MKYNAVLDVEFADEDSTEPVTLQEVKDHCRVDVGDDDALINIYIKAARKTCETFTNTSFIQRTVTANILNQLGGQPLPYGPVIEITAFKDCAGVDIPDTSYQIAGQVFKRLQTCFDAHVTVTYTAGYGELPSDFKTAVLNQAAWLYENRGDAQLKSGLCDQAKLLLNYYRRLV